MMMAFGRMSRPTTEKGHALSVLYGGCVEGPMKRCVGRVRTHVRLRPRRKGLFISFVFVGRLSRRRDGRVDTVKGSDGGAEYAPTSGGFPVGRALEGTGLCSVKLPAWCNRIPFWSGGVGGIHRAPAGCRRSASAGCPSRHRRFQRRSRKASGDGSGAGRVHRNGLSFLQAKRAGPAKRMARCRSISVTRWRPAPDL